MHHISPESFLQRERIFHCMKAGLQHSHF